MRVWLKQLKVTDVAMESTGVYWRPIWNVLDEHGFELLLTNPVQVKGRTREYSEKPGSRPGARMAWNAVTRAKQNLVTDPDQTLWEIYVFHEDIGERGSGSVPELESVARPGSFAKDIPRPRAVWQHRIADPIPYPTIASTRFTWKAARLEVRPCLTGRHKVVIGWRRQPDTVDSKSVTTVRIRAAELPLFRSGASSGSGRK